MLFRSYLKVNEMKVFHYSSYTFFCAHGMKSGLALLLRRLLRTWPAVWKKQMRLFIETHLMEQKPFRVFLIHFYCK